ncbi:hypothetical protein B0H13DRAFT_2088457 [Mycena leptocephala]|nr:hypothetical protein B0H13DRAFT_2088457 [Mycena leptocephala]
MDPPGQGFGLNQVAKLFNDIIAVTRDETPDIAALEPQAVAWLKDARNKLMRDIEAAYHELWLSRKTPLSQPPWTVNPAKSLYLRTNELPAVLEPYRQAIADNLFQFLKDCGFQHCRLTLRTPLFGSIAFNIHFSPQVAAAPHQDPPQTLDVEYNFSQLALGGERIGSVDAFASFGRRLIHARRESSSISTPWSSYLWYALVIAFIFRLLELWMNRNSSRS